MSGGGGSHSKSNIISAFDDHGLRAFRSIVDKIPEQQIRIFFNIINDTHLTGGKRNEGVMFISLAREYAQKDSINLNFK